MNSGRTEAVGLLLLATVLLPGFLTGQEVTVQGRVLELYSDQPVPVVAVQLLEGEFGPGVAATAFTTEGGRFVLRGPSPGTYRIRAQRIGYRTVTTPAFDLVPGEPLEVEVLVAVEAVPLASLVVVSERTARLPHLRLHARGFYERREHWGAEGLGLGHFIERDEIEARGPFQVTDLLRTLPGVRVEGSGRRGQRLLLRSTVSFMGPGRGCDPIVFLDGTPVPLVRELVTGEVEITDINELVSPAALVGIELYPGINQPGEFMRGNHCGTVVLWTGG